MSLTEIVNVVITKETRSISRPGFGTGIIVGLENNISGRAAVFTDATSAKALITGSSPIESAMVDAYFAQSPAPVQLVLGAISAKRIATLTGTMTAGTIKATINGTEVSQAFSVDHDTTMAALLVQIEALSDVDAASTYAVNVFTLVPATDKAIGISFDISAATGLSAVAITSAALDTPEEYDDALDKILETNADWYGIATASRAVADQEKVADWTETNKKFYVAVSSDANIINQDKSTDTTSIAHHAHSTAFGS